MSEEQDRAAFEAKYRELSAFPFVLKMERGDDGRYCAPNRERAWEMYLAGLAAARAQTAELVEALTEVMTWIDNWDPNFIHDDDWRVTKTKVRAALAKVTK